MEEVEQQIQQQQNTEIVSNVRKRYRMTCCVCPVTSTNTPNAIFTRVPIPSTQHKIRKHDTDRIRRSYYRRKYHQKLFLMSLKLKKNDKRTNIRICDNHQREIVNWKFRWTNEYKQIVHDKDDFVLPVTLTEIIDSDDPNEKDQDENESIRLAEKILNPMMMYYNLVDWYLQDEDDSTT
jgi:hypothetical protein